MSNRSVLRAASTEAKLLLIGIPVLVWTLLPIYHLCLFAFSAIVHLLLALYTLYRMSRRAVPVRPERETFQSLPFPKTATPASATLDSLPAVDHPAAGPPAKAGGGGEAAKIGSGQEP